MNRDLRSGGRLSVRRFLRCYCLHWARDVQSFWLTCLFHFLSTESSNGSFNIKASSGYKFGCLAKIVNYMKVSVTLEKDVSQSRGFFILHVVTTASSELPGVRHVIVSTRARLLSAQWADCNRCVTFTAQSFCWCVSSLFVMLHRGSHAPSNELSDSSLAAELTLKLTDFLLMPAFFMPSVEYRELQSAKKPWPLAVRHKNHWLKL